ncbi:MAG: hypothetical protein ACI4OR_04360 [Alphaproteobacteria bacterium]
MSKIKKQFARWGIFLSALFAPIMAQAIAPVVVIAAAYGIYRLYNYFFGDNGSFVKVMESFTSINEGCWFCDIFTTLFNAINTITASLSDTLIADGKLLLGLGLSFYILFKVLKAVVSFGATSPKEFFTELFMPVLKCLVAMAVLYNLGSFYAQVVNPLTALSIGFSTEILSTDSARELTVQVNSRSGTTTRINACDALSSVSTTSQNNGFGPEVNNAIQCFLKTVSSNLILYMALGATFITDSFKLGLIFPKWSMLGVGLCLFIMTFGLFLSFPFKLVDSMFRLMFVSALMPLWVVLWVLPATRGYSKKALDMFLNVLVTFIVLSVILQMSLTILGAALDGLGDNSTRFWQLLTMGKTEEALKMIDWSTGTFFTMLAMTFLANALVKQTDSFVNNFVGGSTGGGMGSALEGAAMAGVALMGNKVAKPVLQKGASEIKEGIKKTPYAAGFVAGRIKSGKPLRWSDVPGAGLAKKTVQAFHEGEAEGYGRNPTDGNAPSPAGSGGTPQPQRPSVSTTSSREQLANGGTKERNLKVFKDANGNVTHQEVEEIVRNANGQLESKIQKRESMTNGMKTGTVMTETRYNKDGTSTKVATEYDALDRKKSTLETTNAGTTKTEFDSNGSKTSKTVKDRDGNVTQTEFDARGNETKITMKDRDGNTTLETNQYDARGVRTGFFTQSTDKDNNITEKFKVNLQTNKKTDLLTGQVSDYIT